MFRSFGLPELAIILVIVMVLFGTTRLPGIGKSLGASMRAFKQAITGEDKEVLEANRSTEEASQDQAITVEDKQAIGANRSTDEAAQDLEGKT